MSSTYMLGELIWAKIKGFSWWPGMVCEPLPSMKLPKRIASLHCVYFFGSNDYGWVTEKSIFPYQEAKEKMVRQCSTAAFMEAVNEIEKYIENAKFGDYNLKQDDHKTKNVIIKNELNWIKEEDNIDDDQIDKFTFECKKERPTYIVPKMFDPKVILTRIDQIKCKICTCYFFNLKDYKLHTLNHVKNESDYICTNYNDGDIKKHKHLQATKIEPKISAGDTKIESISESTKTANLKTNTKENSPMQIRKTRDGKFKCPICSKILKSKRNVALHLRIHTGERPYRCDECGKGFTQPGSLSLHQKRHVGLRDFFCETCHKVFYDKGGLTLHERTHSGVKPYKCKYCDKMFSDPSAFARHLRTHTGCKPYSCSSCPMSFSDASALIQHRKRHKKIKEFSCNICEKQFYTKYSMNKHLTCVHIGLKNFECSVCGKKFASKQYLKIHESHVHVNIKKIECDHCGMKYMHKYELSRHITINHSLVLHYCKNCMRPFGSDSVYRKHKVKCAKSYKMPQCKICNKKFAYPFKLRNHMSVHTERKI